MKRVFSIAALLFVTYFFQINITEGSIHIDSNSITKSDPDFDKNGIVNYNDFAFFADNWLWYGKPGDNIVDLDTRGSVDFNDL